jgi:hypothetical protein
MYYNHRCEPAPVFTPGDRVWLDGSDIATNRPLSKLSHQCLGPFVIKACVGHGTYHLTLPPHFHCLHLSSPWSSCLLRIPIPSLANDLHHPHPQLLPTVRKSMRLRLYLTAECVTTVWSTWSSGRAMMRVTINGRCIHKCMQS